MKRYEDMTREERIEDSDKVAVAALQEELIKGLKKKLPKAVIPSNDLKSIAIDVVEAWLKSKAAKDWIKKRYGRK